MLMSRLVGRFELVEEAACSAPASSSSAAAWTIMVEHGRTFMAC